MAGDVNVLSPHWREVATHAVAFGAAVWVLRKYAWKPILSLLDERRDKIVEEFDGIERGKQANAELKTEFEQQLRTIDAKARAKIKQVTDEGQKVASQIKDQAREESRETLKRAREEIELEKSKAEVALKGDMVKMSMLAAEKVIREKLDPSIHRKLISEMIDEMTRMKST